MSVVTEHVGSQFFVAKVDEPAALGALQAFVAHVLELEMRVTEYVLDPDGVARATTLGDALAATGFAVDRDDQGNLVALTWVADRLPYDTDHLKQLFDSFARYVRVGSFLRIDEQGDEVLLTFEGARVHRDWDGNDDPLHALLREDAARANEQGRHDDALALAQRLARLDDASERNREWAWEQRLTLLRRAGRWDELVAACLEAPRDLVSLEGWAIELEEEAPAAARALATAGLEADPSCETFSQLLARPLA